MEATQPWTTFILHLPRPWTHRWEPRRRVKYRGALLVDLLLVELSPPRRYFALLVGSSLLGCAASRQTWSD
jgi:hypothetical protein